ncbi:MAG: OmpP1/FadL family transporter [Hyphomicrobiales bacterium]
MKKYFLLFMFIALIHPSVFSGGYQVRLQSQKHTGIGLIGTPLAWGSSSIFYNPGALSMYKGRYDVSLGMSFVSPNVVFEPYNSPLNYKTNTEIGMPFYVYFSGKITDKITAGIGVYTPYGSTASWPQDWPGRNIVQSISLKAYFIQPTISYKINDRLGVGAGLVFVAGTVKFEKGLNYSRDSYAMLEGMTDNIGFNIGVYYKPTDKIQLGIDYRSKIEMDLTNGDATFYLPESIYSIVPKDNKFSSTLPLPANLDVGIAYNISDKWMVAAELNWVQWSAYKSLEFKFKKAGELLNQNEPRKYQDRLIYRLGAEYCPVEIVKYRLGIYYEDSPANSDYFSPETVTLNTLGITAGVSLYPIKNLSIDLSFAQTFGFKAEKNYKPANFKGTYQTFISIPGIGISYRF